MSVGPAGPSFVWFELWVADIEVADLEGTIGRVIGSRGSVEKERTAIGSALGWFAIVRDPDGVRIGLWTGPGRA